MPSKSGKLTIRLRRFRLTPSSAAVSGENICLVLKTVVFSRLILVSGKLFYLQFIVNAIFLKRKCRGNPGRVSGGSRKKNTRAIWSSAENIERNQNRSGQASRRLW
jgi:hypothetical protein